MLQVFNEEDLTVLYEARDTKKMVTDLKYDPTGRMLALASADKCVYIYNASDGDYGAKAKCKGHKGSVLHLDFDEFGRRVQTSDSAHSHLCVVVVVFVVCCCCLLLFVVVVVVVVVAVAAAAVCCSSSSCCCCFVVASFWWSDRSAKVQD